MHRKSRVLPLLLALTLALTPATPRAQTAEVDASGRQKVAAYVACAVSVALAPSGPFALVCAVATCTQAYLITQD